MKKIEIYDTTLRDGAQSEDISFSVEDKLRILHKLDEFGIHYIEGGWPGSNPRDVEFFRKAAKLKLKNAKLTAFGSTHRASKKVHQDPGIKELLTHRTHGNCIPCHAVIMVDISPGEVNGHYII